MNKECFKAFPRFETERLIIRSFTETDFQAYVNWHHGDILYYMMGLHCIKKDDIEGFKRLFLKNAPRMFETKESIIWCIAEKETNKSIGKVEICKFDMNANSAQIHYCLAREERGKGYITEVLRCMINWAFNILDINRLYTYVWEENKASANALLKCGFKLEGILRESNTNKFTINGEEIKDTAKDKAFLDQKKNKNEQVYALIKREYITAN